MFVSKKTYWQVVAELEKTRAELDEATVTRRANERLSELWATRPVWDEADDYDG